jgi:putative peptidoglycan binding protein
VELKPRELALAVQTELKRVGCYPGSIDGVWGGRSREALAAFGHFAKVDVAELAPTPQILALIKGKSDAVCVASGEVHHPVGEGAPPPEHAPAHHGGGYYGGGGY